MEMCNAAQLKFSVEHLARSVAKWNKPTARPGAEAEQQPQGQPQEQWEGQRQGQSQGRRGAQGEERREERDEAAAQPPLRERPPSVRRSGPLVGDCSCGPDTSGLHV